MTSSVLATAFIWCSLFIVLGTSWLALKSESLNGVNEAQPVVGQPSDNGGERQSIPVEGELAPNELDRSLQSVERASIHTDNHTEVTNLGVTPLDSSDMSEHEPIVRRRNHPSEQPST